MRGIIPAEEGRAEEREIIARQDSPSLVVDLPVCDMKFSRQRARNNGFSGTKLLSLYTELIL